MRALFLCLPLLFLAACDSTTEAPELDRTALQIRINNPGVNRLEQRFTRSETVATVGVYPEACGGATVLTFVGRNAEGQALRLEATVDTDGALEVPFTTDIPSEDLESEVTFTGPLPGTTETANGFRFNVSRGVLSLIESTPSRSFGAIQVSGGANGFDMDATAAFDVVPSVLSCDNA